MIAYHDSTLSIASGPALDRWLNELEKKIT